MQSVYRAAIQPNRVRLAALFYPAPGVSREQFGRYWLSEHGKKFMSLDIVRKNITKYEQVGWCTLTLSSFRSDCRAQFHLDNDLNQTLASAMGSSPQASTFYGMAIFEAESYEKLLEVFSHPDYQRVVYPDEKVILDRSRSQVVAGQYATFVDKAAKPIKVNQLLALNVLRL